MDNDDYTAKMTELIELMRVIGNDTQQCEVKECKRKISSTITETLSAFSNGNGGYIILGLSEKAGFTPVEDFDARAMQEALSQACEKLTPVVRPVIVTCPFEGANLVFAVIDEMLPREKPCFISSIGPHGGSYIRTGDGDRKMTAYEVDRLLEEQRQPEHDIAVVPEATLDDLNPKLVHALLERERERHPHVFAERSDTDMMLDLRILRRVPADRPADDTVEHAVKTCGGSCPDGNLGYGRRCEHRYGHRHEHQHGRDDTNRIRTAPHARGAARRRPVSAEVLPPAQRHHRRLPGHLTRRRVHRQRAACRLRNHHRPDPGHDRRRGHLADDVDVRHQRRQFRRTARRSLRCTRSWCCARPSPTR